jgi:hypothetical protein
MGRLWIMLSLSKHATLGRKYRDVEEAIVRTPAAFR